VKLHPELLVKLEKLRDAWGSPLILTSGFRCDKHNRKVNGAEASLHLMGQAADVVVLDENQREFSEAAEKAGFDQIVTYGKRNFVHLGIFGRDSRITLPVNQHKWEMAVPLHVGAAA
jgi:uncharacterized protein YcbK (DUF882 family)